LQRRRFLKYAGSAAVVVGASALGLDYLLNSQPHMPILAESSLTTPGNSTSISTQLFSLSGRLFFDKGTNQFGTAGDGIQSDSDMEPGEQNAKVLFMGRDLADNPYLAGTATADSSGDFSIDLPQGNYVIYPVINNPNRTYGYMCQSVADCTPILNGYPVSIGENNSKLYIGLLQGFFSFPEKGIDLVHGGYYNRDPREGYTLAWNGFPDEAPNADSGTHFLAEYGDVIPSFTPGWVSSVNPDTPDNWFTISTSSGFNARFAHSSEILVSPGQKISRYQPIAKAGNRGYTYPDVVVHLQLDDGDDHILDPYKPVYPFDTVPYGCWTSNCGSTDCLHASWIPLPASNTINWHNYWVVENQTHY